MQQRQKHFLKIKKNFFILLQMIWGLNAKQAETKWTQQAEVRWINSDPEEIYLTPINHLQHIF